MNYQRFFLLISGFLAFLTARGAGIADTTVKKSNATQSHNTFNIQDNLSVFKDAGIAIQHDSVEKGMHLLAVVFKKIEFERKISRIMGYKELELYNLITAYDDGAMTAKEKLIIGDFILAYVKHSNQAFINRLQDQLRTLPATPFAPRLKLYFLIYKDNSQLTKEIDKVLRENPILPSVNAYKAEVLYDENKYDECIEYCTRTIALSPQYAHVFELRGNSYSELNDPQKAIDNFNQAITLGPDNGVFYYDRADAWMDLDKYEEAIPDLRKMHALNPSYRWTSYNLARCYYKVGNADSALYFVNIHIRQYPDDEDGYDLKGDLYYDRNNYTEAVDQYSQAIQMAPTHETLYEDRGNAYFYEQKYTDATLDFQKAAQLDKHRAYAQDRLGDCYYQLKEYQKAISCHQQAVKINPAYKFAYIGLSMSKIELKDYKGAIADCKKAIAIDSTYGTALGDLGWAYYCSGDNDGCIAYSYKALKYDERATYAMFNIALATLRKGETGKAKDLYRQFIATCKEKGYTISDGAVDDLKELMKKNPNTEEDCKFIIEHLFEKE